MIEYDIIENGSKNHSFYLRLYVDNKLVKRKSFMSIKLAETGREKFFLEVIEQYVIDLRKAAECFNKSGLENYIENKSISIYGDSYD